MKMTLVALLSAGFVNVALSQVESDAVFLKKISGLEITQNANSLKINEHFLSEKVFYKNYDKHSRESVYYSDFDPVTSLEAYTIADDGSKSKKTKVSVIETKDIFQAGIFYGGYKRKEFVFPNLTPGSIGRLEYTKSITDPHILTPFYFYDDVDVKFAEFSVTFPKSVTIRYKLFGALKDKVKFTEYSTSGKTTYTWILTDVPAYKAEKDSPGNSFSATHVVVFVDSYQAKGQVVRVSSNVSDLYNWYSGLVKMIPVSGDQSSLQETVNNLTKSLTTDEEKVKAIFQWVQQNIKYIAFENGMAGFVPRAAPDVYTKRYGDCKDMANLLKSMINLAGVDAYLTWIGTRSKPYTYEEVPSTVADNHMICAVKMDKQYMFLDATNPFLSFGMPSSMIQGKEALIGLQEGQFAIVKVPEVDASVNQRSDTIRMTLEKRGISGIFSSHLKGYQKDDIEIEHLKAELQNDQEYIRDFFTVGDNNIAIEGLRLTGFGARNGSAKVNFNFFQPGYYKNAGDKIYINLNLNKSLPGEKIDAEKRIQPREEKYRYENRFVTVLTLPEGYTVEFKPADVEKKWPEFGITSRYTLHEKTVVFEKIIYSNYLYLDKSHFPAWNEFIEQVMAVNLQSITLKK